MKKTRVAFSLLFMLLALPTLHAQRCGQPAVLQHILTDAAQKQRFENAGQVREQAFRQYATSGLRKSAAQHPIPVVFHFVITQTQYTLLGEDTGILRRVLSQMQVLNQDFSATNADLSQVPGPFQSFIGTAGIAFTRAIGTSTHTIAPGVEVRIIPPGVFFDPNTGCADAKRFASGGLDAWNPSQYLNIWCLNTGGQILGLTIPPAYVGYSTGSHVLSDTDKGIVLHHGVTGEREYPTQYFVHPENDRGRTLTHEAGHFFELLHLWDDFGGGCNAANGTVDSVADTPPQQAASYCATTCPTFPKFDNCSPSGNGIMFMNFMDYVDDRYMFFFTQGQVARMQFFISPGQESYPLTQNPRLQTENPYSPTSAALIAVPYPQAASVWELRNNGLQALGSISVYNASGSRMTTIPEMPAGAHRKLDLSNCTPGLYLLRYAQGSETHTLKLMIAL